MVRRLAGRIARRVIGPIANARRRARLQQQRDLRLHLGCGDDKLPGFVNLDYRLTGAVDVALDLNLPPLAAESVALAFSHAFFEHLYRASRLPHLRRIREALAPGGVCCYLGVPYFRNIARLYVERGPGTASAVFDLFNVYRYTHGDPEGQQAWWLGQLHKSLFDEDELGALLAQAGFGGFVMFAYGYPGDVNEVAVTMGFYATRDPSTPEELRRRCLAFLQPFADTRIRLETLQWLTPA
jgi:predicted SAM-dependent methyltransferase